MAKQFRLNDQMYSALDYRGYDPIEIDKIEREINDRLDALIGSNVYGFEFTPDTIEYVKRKTNQLVFRGDDFDIEGTLLASILNLAEEITETAKNNNQ